MNKKGVNFIKVVDLKRFSPEIHARPPNCLELFRPKVSIPKKSNTNTCHTFFTNNLLENTNPHDTKCLTDITVDGTDERIKRNKTDASQVHEQPDICRNLDNFKRKVKLRTCSHSPEELSKLTEHHDETLVKLGDTFDSRESFRQYLNDKAKSWFYYYVCRNSKKQIIEYNCICMAYNLKHREAVYSKKKKRTTACPCKIRLSCDTTTKKVVVYYVCNHHDHPVTDSAFQQYPHAKYLPQHAKDELLDLAYLGLDIDLIQRHIHSIVGITIKRKDIWSYAYKLKRNTIQRSLTAEREEYMKDLILRIRKGYKEPFDKAKGNTVTDQERTVNNKGDLITQNESEENLEEVLSTDKDVTDAAVIIQYIDEKGILCDENGTPVTNSSAIMQFINNYEDTLPEPDSEQEQYIEDGTVFSDLVESIDEEVYPAWDSVHEVGPLFERTSVICKNQYFGVSADDLAASSDGAQELFVIRTQAESSTDLDKSETVLSDTVNSDERLQTPRPGRYAEIDNFKKYYFVDHRYIRYEGDNDKDLDQKEDRHRDTYVFGTVNNEYVKAPDQQVGLAPVRYCTGHESLTSLSAPDAILAGTKFLHHHAFLDYINDRAHRWFFYYSLMKSGKSPEYYVYKCVYGKTSVSKNAYRAKGLRKRSKLTTTQCPCQIRLRRLDSDPTYLTVLYSCNHHDHALDSRLFNAQPHSRRLPNHLKEEVKDLLSLGVTFDVLRKYVTAETGLRIYVKYFHNVKVKMRKNNENRQFTEERFMALSKKIQDLQALYGNKSKKNRQGKNAMKRKREPSQVLTEDRFTQVGLDEAATQTMEYFEIDELDDVAEEVCIVQEDAFTPHVPSKLSR